MNADDAGFHADQDAAILRCAGAGLVRAATVVANGPTAAAFVAVAAGAGLDLGLHVNLTEGEALAGPHRTLTDAAGRFPGKAVAWRRACEGRLDPGEVRREVVAQWERVRELGGEPTHVDGHNHAHLFPAVRAVLQELAWGLYVRAPRAPFPADLPKDCAAWAGEVGAPWKCADHFAGYAFAADPTGEVFLASLDDRAAVTEFMVHPGARPGTAFTRSDARDRETEALCSAPLLREVEARGYRVCSFAEVSCG